MKELKCPNCGTVVNVKDSADEVVCDKCLANYSKQFIMVESPDTESQPKNLGGGFFEK